MRQLEQRCPNDGQFTIFYGQNIQQETNKMHSWSKQLYMKFSSGWLKSVKKLFDLKFHRDHGKSFNARSKVISKEYSQLRDLLRK